MIRVAASRTVSPVSLPANALGLGPQAPSGRVWRGRFDHASSSCPPNPMQVSSWLVLRERRGVETASRISMPQRPALPGSDSMACCRELDDRRPTDRLWYPEHVDRRESACAPGPASRPEQDVSPPSRPRPTSCWLRARSTAAMHSLVAA